MINQILTATETADTFSAYLESAGSVFQVFDRQDSGCVSYGATLRGAQYFIKYSEDREAVTRLYNAAFLHDRVAHENIPAVCQRFLTKHGFGLIFRWVEGENLYVRQEERDKPESPYRRFRSLPVGRIVRVLNRIYEIHTYLEQLGYVAVDFYDGSLLYDFSADKVHVIDLDHYECGPFLLKEKRLPGSARFMAPEEWVRGSVIDTVTNVYTMGAAAFEFLGGGPDRAKDKWRAGKRLYEAALQAVNDERGRRYPSVAAFYKAWLAAQAE